MQTRLDDVIIFYNIKVSKYRKQGIEPNDKLRTMLWNEALGEVETQNLTLELYKNRIEEHEG